MTDVIEAMDDAYKRAERKFSSIDKQLEWLSGFGAIGGLNDYEKGALMAAENLRTGVEIQSKLPKASVFSIEQLELEARKIDLVPVRQDVLADIKVRKSELSSQYEKVLRQTEKEYESKIDKAETPEEVKKIVEEAKSTAGVPNNIKNRINQDGLDRIKDLRVKAAKEKQIAEQQAKRERDKEEEIQREKEEAEEARREEARREEARRIQREGQARKDAEREAQRQAEREYQRNEDIRRQEEQLNLEAQS